MQTLVGPTTGLHIKPLQSNAWVPH